MVDVERIHQLFTSPKNYQFILNSIRTTIQHISPDFNVITISTQLHSFLTTVWSTNIDTLYTKANGNAKIIIQTLNSYVIDSFSKQLLNSYRTPPQNIPNPSQETPLENLPPKQVNEIPELNPITIPIIKTFQFPYSCKISKGTTKINHVNFNKLKTLQLSECTFLNTLYNITSKHNKIHIKIGTKNTTYTLQPGYYPNIQTLITHLNERFREGGIAWYYENITGTVRVEYNPPDQKNGQFTRTYMDQFQITFDDNVLPTQLGFNQKEYSGGKKYISENICQFHTLPRLTIHLSKALHSIDIPFFEKSIPDGTFNQTVELFPKDCKLDLLTPIHLDDLEITCNLPLSCQLVFQVTCEQTLE